MHVCICNIHVNIEYIYFSGNLSRVGWLNPPELLDKVWARPHDDLTQKGNGVYKSAHYLLGPPCMNGFVSDWREQSLVVFQLCAGCPAEAWPATVATVAGEPVGYRTSDGPDVGCCLWPFLRSAGPHRARCQGWAAQCAGQLEAMPKNDWKQRVVV